MKVFLCSPSPRSARSCLALRGAGKEKGESRRVDGKTCAVCHPTQHAMELKFIQSQDGVEEHRHEADIEGSCSRSPTRLCAASDPARTPGPKACTCSTALGTHAVSDDQMRSTLTSRVRRGTPGGHGQSELQGCVVTGTSQSKDGV